MIPTRGLRHIQIDVRDPERSLAFYGQLLGMKELFRDAGALFAQVPGGADMITFARSPDRRNGDHGGLRHFGFAVARDFDTEAAVREIEDAGGTVLRTGEHGPGQPYIYFEDLDGYEVELSPI